MARKKRFFYHYYRQKDKMSVHFEGRCQIVDAVSCLVPSETHRQKRQPRLVVRGWATQVFINNERAIIL